MNYPRTAASRQQQRPPNPQSRKHSATGTPTSLLSSPASGQGPYPNSPYNANYTSPTIPGSKAFNSPATGSSGRMPGSRPQYARGTHPYAMNSGSPSDPAKGPMVLNAMPNAMPHAPFRGRPNSGPGSVPNSGHATLDPASNRAAVANKLRDDCYNKYIKENGQNVREITYLSHLLVKEYSQYSAMPPPPNAPESQLGSIKERVLVLCSKYSGRVLLQKGKFNELKNQYQIGRTWDLDELKVITKAGESGIILSLNKDYYWDCGEGPDRVERFAKYLAKTYGSFVGKYPVINGWTLEDFDLPVVPSRKSFGTVPAQQEPYPQADPQLMKTKSLKRKNLPNPVLPVQPQNRQNSQSSFGSPPAPLPPQELYKDLDFTANGKLPMKPMKVLDRSGDVSQTSLPDGPSSVNQTSEYLNESSNLHPYRNVTPTRSEAELTNDSQSFIFGPEDLNEELPKQRKASVDHKRQETRNVSEPLESKAALHMQLEEKLSRPNAVFDSSNNSDLVNEESETTEDEAKLLLNKNRIPEIDEDRDINDVTQSSNIHDEDFGNIDSSIQEIEQFMDSQLNFGAASRSRSGKFAKPPVNNEVIVIDSLDGDVLEDRSFSEAGNGTNTQEFTEFETDTESELNINRKGTLSHDKDPEIEELLDELQWDLEDDCGTLVKKLTEELNKLKYNNVKELISLDFSGDSMKGDLDTSLNEVENINHIFRKLEINFKTMAPEINAIENNSQGLQVKSVNKKLLFNDLKSILDKVSINARDLSGIESFKDFDRINRLEPLEFQVSNLYNALETIKQDQNQDPDESRDQLNSLSALNKYLASYESVSKRFVKHFLDFFMKQFSFRMDQLNSLDRVYPKSLFVELNSLTIYSAFTYFVKETCPNDFNDLKTFVSTKLSEFLERFLKLRIRSIKYTDDLPGTTPTNLPNSTRLDNSEGSLKKSRTLRLSARKDKLIGKLGFSDEDHSPKPSAPSSPSVGGQSTTEKTPSLLLSSSGVEDTKTIVDLVNDAKEISIVLTNFLGQVFHYENNVYNLNDFLDASPFEKRIEQLDKSSIEIANDYSSDLISLLNTVFGNFNNLFIKKIIPVQYNIPVVLVYLESLSTEPQNDNLDFFIFNFLKKVLDKYKHNWSKFVKIQTDAVNKSSITAKSGILPSIRNVNHFFHLVESTLDKPSRLYGDWDKSNVKVLLNDSYKEITGACIHLFVKDDPLLKNTEYDEKERNYRNVSILQNIFSLSEQLVLFNNERTNKVRAQLDTVFKRVKDTYFNKLLNQNIGKIVEFVNNYEAMNDTNLRAKKYNKKAVRSVVAGYSTKEVGNRASEIHRKLEKHFITGNNMFEKDLLDKLWSDMEKQFVNYFSRLDNILSRNYSDIDFHVSKQDIHSIFRSLN